MEDVLDTLCTLVLLAAAGVSGSLAVVCAAGWVVSLFGGELIAIVGGLPMAGFFVLVSRFFLRWI